MSTHNLCFEQKYEKYQNFLSENFHFLVVKISVYLKRHDCIRNGNGVGNPHDQMTLFEQISFGMNRDILKLSCLMRS